MEDQTRKMVKFGIGLYGVLILSSVLGGIFMGEYYFYRYSIFLYGIMMNLHIFAVIVAIFQGALSLNKKHACKVGSGTALSGFFILFIFLIIFDMMWFEPGIFFGYIFSMSIAGAGGALLGNYFKELNKSTISPEVPKPTLHTHQKDQYNHPIRPQVPKHPKPVNRSSSEDTSYGRSSFNTCPSCGQDVKEEWNVCIYCGGYLKK